MSVYRIFMLHLEPMVNCLFSILLWKVSLFPLLRIVTTNPLRSLLATDWITITLDQMLNEVWLTGGNTSYLMTVETYSVFCSSGFNYVCSRG